MFSGRSHCYNSGMSLLVVKALGYDPEKVKVVIHQFVTLMRDGEQVRCPSGLRTLLHLMNWWRSRVRCSTLLLFNAFYVQSSGIRFESRKKSNRKKTRFYYLQYAHARIASILRFAEEQGTLTWRIFPQASIIVCSKDRLKIALTKLLLDFPETIESCAMHFEPHRLTTYLQDIAAAFHRFYHEHRIVIPELDIAKARLVLCLPRKQYSPMDAPFLVYVPLSGCKVKRWHP